MKARKKRKNLAPEERQQPQTIEDKQIANEDQIQEYQEAQMDEFNPILNDEIPVKILITTSIRPPVKIYDFLK